jgi:pimeloyl-ACP methyl ester carboxylesterase
MNIKRLFFLAVLYAGMCTFPQSGEAQTSTSNINGSWQGTLVAGATKLGMVFKLTESNGQVTGTLDIPEAGATNIPLEHLSYADRILSCDFKIGAPTHYEGVMSRDATEVTGSFTQGGNIIPLNLTHTGAQPDPNVPKPAVLMNPRRKLELQPCGQAGLTKDALCGQSEVFEDRARNAGRKIKLNVMVLPALVDKPAPDPIFYFQGGPGGAATSVAGAWIMARKHRTRDVVLVDQRGTGKSNPLQCNVRGDLDDMRGYFGEAMTIDAVRACRAELEKNADLRLYTTTIAMADIDEVRTALGYDKINVEGGSYGSTAALSYLNLYPQHVRTVTISGVAPPNNTLLLNFAAGVEHALNRLFDDCAGEEKCHAAFPDLRKDWATVVDNVTKAPVTFASLNAVTRQKQQITMTRAGFGESVRHMLYQPNLMSIMPLMIHQMSGGDYTQFAYYAFQVQRALDLALARGMQLSVLCAEDVPFIKESEIDPATKGTFYGGERARLYLKACEQWPHGDMPAKFRQSIKSDIPVLILSGELDPVTPPNVATPLLKGLPNGRQVIMKNATHNSYECSEKLARDFIEKGTAKDLDTSCVEDIKRLPFLTALTPLVIPK